MKVNDLIRHERRTQALTLLLVHVCILTSVHVNAQSGLGSSDEDSSTTKSQPPYAIIILSVFAFLFFGGMLLFMYCWEHRSVRSHDHSLSEPVSLGLGFSFDESFKVLKYSELSREEYEDVVAVECAVCLNAFEDNETVRLMPKCRHIFHRDCVDRWLSSHSTCPYCRMDLVSKREASNNVVVVVESVELGDSYGTRPRVLV